LPKIFGLAAAFGEHFWWDQLCDKQRKQEQIVKKTKDGNEPPQGKPCGIENFTLKSLHIRGNKSHTHPVLNRRGLRPKVCKKFGSKVIEKRREAKLQGAEWHDDVFMDILHADFYGGCGQGEAAQESC